MLSSLFGGFDLNKFKPNLKMAVHRIKLTTSKKQAALRKERREVSELLRAHKFDKARIRVESIIRKDNDIEAHEILELMCELLHERSSLMKAEKECPPDLVESVSTIIWAANRCQIPELNAVKKQLANKYGSDFAAAARSGSSGRVNTKVQLRLSVQAPTISTVSKYLKAIADEFEVEYDPEEDAPEASLLESVPIGGKDVPPMMPPSTTDMPHPAGEPMPPSDVPSKPSATLPPGYTVDPSSYGGAAPPPYTTAPPAGYALPPGATYPPAGYGAPQGYPPAGYGAPPPGYGAPPPGYPPAGMPPGPPAPGGVPPMLPPFNPAPGATGAPAPAPASTDVGFDELSSRFAALRKS